MNKKVIVICTLLLLVASSIFVYAAYIWPVPPAGGWTCHTNADCDDSNAESFDYCRKRASTLSHCYNSALDIQCSQDVDCNDGNTSTMDVCNLDNTVDSSCAIITDYPPSCVNDAACNDSNAMSEDICHDAGGANSWCSHHPYKTTCYTDAQCDDANYQSWDICEDAWLPAADCNNTWCIECENDAACNDSNCTTIDICNNDNTCDSDCVNLFWGGLGGSNDPACNNDDGCDDSDDTTYDQCINPTCATGVGDESSSCNNLTYISVSGVWNSFGYLKGGDNTTIAFDVQFVVPDYNAMIFLVDLNYAYIPIAGTGVSIADDLNLSMDFTHDTNSLIVQKTYTYDWASASIDANVAMVVCILASDGNRYCDVGDFNIMIDSTKPTTAWDKDTNSWYNANQTVELTCSDNNAGCNNTKYRYQQLTTTLGSFIEWQNYTSAIVMDSEGTWRWEYYSTDNATHTGDTNVQFFYLDKTRPTFTLTSLLTGDWNLMSPALDVNLHMIAYDVTSGIDTNKFRIDDDNKFTIDWGAWQDFDQNVMIDWNAYGDGNFAVQFVVTDLAGLDSNSDINGDIYFVLLDQNGPLMPVSLTPSTGNYVNTMTITCSEQIWVRDINYIIEIKEFETGETGEDWNQIYNDTSNSFLFDFSYIASNSDTQAQLRCKHIDPDKNSGYYTNDFNIMLQPDTGFDTIENALPAAPTIITSASAPFSVNATDIGNVIFCTFEVFVNAINVGDFNGTPPANDTNSGIWTYIYTALIDNDVTYVQVYCQDGTGNTSATISSSTYTYDYTAPPPSGGAGGGGGLIEILNFLLREPADGTIVKLMLAGTEDEFELVVKNDSEQNFLLEVVPDANISEYVSCENMKQIEVAQIETIICTVDLTDYNAGTALQETLEGTISLRVPGKTIEVPVKILIIQPGGITWLILLIKETPYGFSGAIVIIFAGLALATAGIIGVIKDKRLQVLATLGGGSLATFLIFMLVII